MGLYENSDGNIGYQHTIIEDGNPEEHIQYVQEEAPEYIIHHEMHTTGMPLSDLVDDVLD